MLPSEIGLRVALSLNRRGEPCGARDPRPPPSRWLALFSCAVLLGSREYPAEQTKGSPKPGLTRRGEPSGARGSALRHLVDPVCSPEELGFTR